MTDWGDEVVGGTLVNEHREGVVTLTAQALA
jgi:hypothetical protein